MNYDPNLVSCGRMVKEVVKLTFAQWDYRAEMTVQVHGNCLGLTVISSAVRIAFDQLPTVDDDVPVLKMTRANGDVLECEDDECEGEDFLLDLLIGAEIISITPEAKANS